MVYWRVVEAMNKLYRIPRAKEGRTASVQRMPFNSNKDKIQSSCRRRYRRGSLPVLLDELIVSEGRAYHIQFFTDLLPLPIRLG